jgi:thymidylate kinase
MIIEFIGCTGSGKTTLIRELQSRLQRKTSVTTATALVQSRLGLPSITNPTVQNVIQEVVGFPRFISSLYRHRSFIEFTVRMLTRGPNVSIWTINNLRSLVRKIGIYEIARHYSKDYIILMDEGPILAAHMFVFDDALGTVREIDKFAASLPLPDLVVYVRATVDTIVTRTLKRPDPPRKLTAKDPILTEAYARAALAMFDRLVEAENIKPRLLVVDSTDSSERAYHSVVDSVADFILGIRDPVNESRTSC